MPFHRRMNMNIRPVNRIKHVIDTQQALAVGTQQNNGLIAANDNPVLANTTEVQTGAKVNAVYLNVEAYATTGAALSNIYMIVFKNPGGNLTVPAPNTVGSDDDKRFVIHQEMKMLQREPTADSAGGNPRTIFNGVIVIPRGYRRFAPNDLLQLAFLTPGVTADVCFQCHYKEFR